MIKNSYHLLGLLLFLSFSAADLQIGSYNPGLSPGRLTWWRSSWSPSPLELSKINESASGVSITIRWSPSTDLLSGVLELVLPEDLTVSEGSNTLRKDITNIRAGADILTTMDQTLTNPSAGFYGPVKLRTRLRFKNSYGQIVDSNENFGMIYIAERENLSDTQLEVGLYDQNPRAGYISQILVVKFKLASDIWKHTLFKLTPDPHFILSDSVECESYKEGVRYFNGTNANKREYVSCEKSEGNVLYVYGLGNDIDIKQPGAESVELRIYTVDLPKYQITADFMWKLEVIRYATRWVLQEGIYTDGPSYEPGLISGHSWEPTLTSLSNHEVLKGMTLFINISFNTVNPIPLGGYIEITLSEFTSKENYIGNTSSGCYLSTQLSGVYCTVGSSPNRILISGFSNTPSTNFFLSTLVHFSSDTFSILSIQSKTSQGYIIDSTDTKTDPKVFQLSTHNILSVFEMHMTAFNSPSLNEKNTAGNLGEDDYSEWIVFKMGGISSPTDIQSGVSFNFYFPFTSTAGAPTQDKAFYINYREDDISPWFVAHQALLSLPVSGGVITAQADIDYKLIKPSYQDYTSLPSSLSFTLDSKYSYYISGKTPTSTLYFTLHKSSFTPLGNPLVSNNAQTRYQALVKIQDTRNPALFSPYYGVCQFHISPAAWLTSTFSPFSRDNIAGMPAVIILSTPNLSNTFPPSSPISDRTYYIELELSNYNTRMNSGLENGGSFPCWGIERAECEIWHDEVNDLVNIRVRRFGVIYNSEVKLYVTLGDVKNVGSSVNGVIRGYYIENEDVHYVKYVTFESNAGSYSPNVNTSPQYVSEKMEGIESLNLGSLSSGGSVYFEHSFVGSLSGGSEASDRVVFIAPEEFGIEGNVSLVLSDENGEEMVTKDMMYFSTPGMKWATVVGTEMNVDHIKSSGSLKSLILVNGLRLSYWNNVNGYVFYALSKRESFEPSSYALAVNKFTVSNLKLGNIRNERISPKSIRSSGPDLSSIDMSISFTTSSPIPIGGSILISINPRWEYLTPNYFSYTISGLSDQSPSNPLSISYQDSIISISSFSPLSGNSSITLMLRGMIPPNMSSSGSLPFIRSITTYKDTTTQYPIDNIESSNISNNDITISLNTSTPGTSKIEKFITFPMNAGLIYPVDLYVKFSLNRNIPKGGYITLVIQSLEIQYYDGDIYKNCWLSGASYSACESSGNNVVITLGEDYSSNQVLELYLDSAVINPKTTTRYSTVLGFRATYGTILIIQDANFASLTATPKMQDLLNASISISVSNIGEYSDYTFNFQTPVELTNSHEVWIIFPSEYDFSLDGEEIFNDYKRLYLDCSSRAGNIWCTVSHNIVRIWGFNRLNPLEDISIVLKNIINPDLSYEFKSNLFQVYHVTNPSTYEISAGLEEFGRVTLGTSVPNNIIVRSISSSSTTLQTSTTLTFTLYINQLLTDSHSILITFPRQWSLQSPSTSDLICYLTLQQDSDDHIISSEELEWISPTSCNPVSNTIRINISPNEQKILTYSTTVRLYISNISNPYWGYIRSSDSTLMNWEFELKDFKTFEESEYWTDKFIISVFDSATEFYTSKAAQETAGMYLGYNGFGREILVNMYDERSRENRIVVYAGTGSEVVISIGSGRSCTAEEIVLQPTIYKLFPSYTYYNEFTISSRKHDWTLKQGQSSISFELSSSISSTHGLYYISWSQFEFPFSRPSNLLYQFPIPTLLEIIPISSNPLPITISSIPPILLGHSSIPIKISLPFSPNSDLTIKIYIKPSIQSEKISITPSTVTFLPNIKTQYFVIDVDRDYKIGLGYSEYLIFEVEGTDAAAYQVERNRDIEIIEGEIANGFMISLGIGEVGMNSASITPIGSQDGVIYIFFSAIGNQIPSAEDMIKNVISLVDAEAENSLTPLEEKILQNQQIMTTSRNKDESWQDYRMRLYRLHIQDTFSTAIVYNLSSTPQKIELSWLWSSTTYQVSAYLVSSNLASEIMTSTFTTLSDSNSVSFSCNFIGNVLEEDIPSISASLAKFLEVVDDRIEFRYLLSPREAINNAYYSRMYYYLYSEKSKAKPIPFEMIQYLNQNLALARKQMLKEGINYELAALGTYQEIQPVKPVWNEGIQVLEVNDNTVKLKVRSSISGIAVCIADESFAGKPTSMQVYLGLNANNVQVSMGRESVNVDHVYSVVEIGGLIPETEYEVWCIAADSLPIWPGLMEESETAPSKVSVFTMSIPENEESKALYETILLAMVLICILY